MSFHKGPRGKDYGGNRYGRSPYRTKLSDSLSYHCRDCRKKRYVSPLELNRAARPRCLACGGPLIETDVTAEKTMSEATARNTKKANEELPDPKGVCRCFACNLGWRKNYHLGKHIKNSESCRKCYQDSALFINLAEKTLFRGTLSIFRGTKGRGKWLVVGLSENNDFVVIKSFSRLCDAEKFVQDHSISLKAARTIQDWYENPKKEPPNYIRCPSCGAKFVNAINKSAHECLLLHLAYNNDCFKELDDLELKKEVSKI